MMKLGMEHGEIRHVKLEIKSLKQEAFSVIDAIYELRNCACKDPEDKGIAEIIDQRILDVVVAPQKEGDYDLKFTYRIADETFIDIVRLQVT